MTKRYTQEAPPNCPECKAPMRLTTDENWNPRRNTEDMDPDEFDQYMCNDHTAWIWFCDFCWEGYSRSQYGVAPFVERPKRTAVPEGQLSLLTEEAPDA